MAICNLCEEEFNDKRRALGYETCLECGEKAATKEADRRREWLAPDYNKGGSQNIGDLFDAHDAGKS